MVIFVVADLGSDFWFVMIGGVGEYDIYISMAKQEKLMFMHVLCYFVIVMDGRQVVDGASLLEFWGTDPAVQWRKRWLAVCQ